MLGRICPQSNLNFPGDNLLSHFPPPPPPQMHLLWEQEHLGRPFSLWPTHHKRKQADGKERNNSMEQRQPSAPANKAQNLDRAQGR